MPKTPAKKSAPRSASARELVFGDLWKFDPSSETADPKLKNRYDLFIGGKFVAPKGEKYFPTIRPSNEAKLAHIGHASFLIRCR